MCTVQCTVCIYTLYIVPKHRAEGLSGDMNVTRSVAVSLYTCTSLYEVVLGTV